MIGRLAALRRATYARYLGASAGALGVDVGAFLLLLAAHAPAALASGIGYAAGVRRALVAVEPRGVRRVGRRGARRAADAAGAVPRVGGRGLALTMGVVGLGAALGLDPRLAKLVAIALSFQAVWLLRRHVVFGRNPA